MLSCWYLCVQLPTVSGEEGREAGAAQLTREVLRELVRAVGVGPYRHSPDSSYTWESQNRLFLTFRKDKRSI